MAELKFIIKKQALTETQITLIRMYKAFLIPPESYVEEYQQGFKFYYVNNTNVNNIIEFFRGYGIYTISQEFFNEEWTY